MKTLFPNSFNYCKGGTHVSLSNRRNNWQSIFNIR